MANRDGSPRGGIARSLGALLVLLVGLVGVPVALVALGGNPLPESLSWAAVQRALLQPDDGTVLVGLITLLGWAAWLVFAVSVLAELVSVASGYRLKVQLPGLAGPQRMAAGLLVAVLALAPAAPAAPPDIQAGVATAVPLQHSEAREHPSPAPEPEDPPPVPAAARGEVRPTGKTHVVESGDDLWSLAERYYDAGRDWRKIAMANPHVLTGGPDRLQPGWKLTIPGVDDEPDEDAPTVTVRKGDTLSEIAERELGEESEWRDLYRANRAQLSDPDELSVGTELVLPEQASEPDKSAPQREKRSSTAESRPEAAEDEPGETRPRTAPRSAETLPAPAPEPGRAPTSTSEAPAPLDPAATDAEPESDLDETTVALGVAGAGALLAAGLVAGLTLRRRAQLQARPLGRRIVHPSPPAQRVEAALGRRQQPMGLRSLDLALRAISAHCLVAATPVPRLALAAVGADELELVLTEEGLEPPSGFVGSGRSWRVGQAGLAQLRSRAHVGEALRPYPALVTLGEDDQGRTVLADLETLGLLALTPEEPGQAVAVLTAMALELAFSPWADEMILTLVGGWPELPEALDKHNVSQTNDVGQLLVRLEQRASEQRAHQPAGPRGHVRINPDLADPWAPEVVLIASPLTAEQSSRLVALVTGDVRPTLAAVTAQPLPDAAWRLDLRGPDAVGRGRARLEPEGLDLTCQRLEPTEVERLVELVAATGSTATSRAPWWVPDEPDPPPDNVTYLGARFGGWSTPAAEGGDTVIAQRRAAVGATGHPPLLQLLGPVELVGAAGVLPSRASKQCLEYCGWLLEHPGTSAQAMAAALVVAEGTRRSNMSRLRTWLGTGPEGEPYLPDAYTGRISLHPWVSSDWQELQLLTSPGVNRASDQGLRMALELVRGAPLADAAPGQWHWAEELRTDMISAVRDIGVELANRALNVGDLDLARWAAARALVAAPGDELLLAARVHTEHQAGNPAETERLTLQLVAQSRTLGVDLDPATVTLLQQVMEGRVRARLA